MKKAIEHHLDWIIGVGIFLLFTVFILATLKPGYQKTKEGEILLSILEDKIEENLTWKVEKIPLKVIQIRCQETESCISLEWPYYNTNKVKVLEADFSISNGKLIINSKNLGTYTVLISEEFPSAQDGGSCSCEDVEYIYGVPEVLEGYSEQKINALVTNYNENYENLRHEWNFPGYRDFKITFKWDEISKSVGKDPPENMQVYVKVIHDNLLTENGTLEHLVITLETW